MRAMIDKHGVLHTDFGDGVWVPRYCVRDAKRPCSRGCAGFVGLLIGDKGVQQQYIRLCAEAGVIEIDGLATR